MRRGAQLLNGAFVFRLPIDRPLPQAGLHLLGQLAGIMGESDQAQEFACAEDRAELEGQLRGAACMIGKRVPPAGAVPTRRVRMVFGAAPQGPH